MWKKKTKIVPMKKLIDPVYESNINTVVVEDMSHQKIYILILFSVVCW